MAIVKECRYISVPLKRINGREVLEPKRLNGDLKVYINESLVLICLILILKVFYSLKVLRGWAFKGFAIISLTILIIWGIYLITKTIT